MAEHFFLRLNPPRPTFSLDMSDEEREMMGRHVAYWSERLANGDLVAFGPVADPQGGYGIAIAKADDEDAVWRMIAADPVLTEGEGFSYDVLAMPGAIS